MSDTDNSAPEHAELDVKSSHIVQEWKYSAPLIGCRYDDNRASQSIGPQTILNEGRDFATALTD